MSWQPVFDEIVKDGALHDTLQEDKKKLRNSVLAWRDALPAATRTAASTAILAKVRALSSYRDAKVVLGYMGFGTEIETRGFIERIIADGKMAVLPRVDRESRSLILHDVRGMSELLASKWGILEPLPDARQVSINDIEFVLMPGVAFDRSGNRLGYGRGYYDKLIGAADSALVRVAAAFSCQLVDRVPVGPGDLKVHRIITENETISSPHDR